MNNINNTNIYRLTDEERDYLATKLDSVTYDPDGGQEYIKSVRTAILQSLPNRVLDAFFDQRTSLSPSPYIILENTPTDDQVFFTPNPSKYTRSAKTGSRSENLLCGIGSLVGEPYSIKFEGQELVNNLIPTHAGTSEYTGLGSMLELDFHIENAALKFIGEHSFSPLGLLLTGVRHDPNGPATRLADARKALKKLTQADIDELRSHSYTIKLPYRWRNLTGESPQTNPVPLFTGSIELPDVSAVFYPGMINATTSAAERALRSFYQAIKSVSFGLDIKPATLVYIDNRLTLHSRDKFSPTLDTNGHPLRWVQRIFVAENLWAHRQLQAYKSRVFDIIKEEE